MKAASLWVTGWNIDVIELSSVILFSGCFPYLGPCFPLEWFFHRLNVLLVGDLAGVSLVKWIDGSRGNRKRWSKGC